MQCFGSGFILDPDSISSVDPYPDSESGFGPSRAKIIKKIEKDKKFNVLKCWMFSFEG
jgi:hypothetical protein